MSHFEPLPGWLGPNPIAGWIGPHGRLEPITVPEAAHTAVTTTYCALITAPAWHPVWSQYVVTVVDLAPHPGVREATLQFPGATHELLVFAVNPAHGRLTPDRFNELVLAGTSVYLSPVNIVHQFTATDDEMRTIAWLCGRAVTEGELNPETGDAPDRVREEWLQACVLSLAHLRGEEHAHG